MAASPSRPAFSSVPSWIVSVIEVRRLLYGKAVANTSPIQSGYNGGMLRILIASPHPALRAGLHVLLEEAQRSRATEPVMVVGEADTIDASLQWTRATQPQVVLYDLAFELDEDLPGLWRLRTQSPEVAILTLCEANSDGRLLAALQGGARGCLPKTSTGPEIL